MDSRRNKISKIILQEQEEDDEMFFVLVLALYSCLYEEKQPVHTSSLSGAAKVKEILEGHQSWARVEFRMEPAIFMSIFFDIIPALAQRFIKIPSSLQPHSKIVSSTLYWPYFQVNRYDFSNAQ